MRISPRLFRSLATLFALCLSLALAAPAAHAQESGPKCTFSISSISFGTVDVKNGRPYDATGTLTYACTGDSREIVRICPSLGLAADGSRFMTDAARQQTHLQPLLRYQPHHRLGNLVQQKSKRRRSTFPSVAHKPAEAPPPSTRASIPANKASRPASTTPPSTARTQPSPTTTPAREPAITHQGSRRPRQRSRLHHRPRRRRRPFVAAHRRP